MIPQFGKFILTSIFAINDDEDEDSRPFVSHNFVENIQAPKHKEEKKEVEVLLGKKDVDKAGVIRDLVWALMTSIEFRFQV